MLHAERDDLVHRAAAELAAAEAAEVLGGKVAASREAIEAPRLAETRGDVFPQMPEPIIGLPRSGEAAHVEVDDLDPMAHCRRCGGTFHFVKKARHRRAQRQRIEPRKRRR